MKVTSAEFAYVRPQNLYNTVKCDGCGKLLNRTVQFVINGKPEVDCSAVCRGWQERFCRLDRFRAPTVLQGAWLLPADHSY
jgi:hypothetical protein